MSSTLIGELTSTVAKPATTSDDGVKAMARNIPSDHPLSRLFRSLVLRRAGAELGLADRALLGYLADLLTRFVHVDALYAVRDAAGQPLDDVGEMLLESDPRGRAASFVREREVRRHIGDFTLFLLGLFPEWVRAHATTRLPDVYVDWSRTGRESYRIVASFTVPPFAEEAPLFRALAEQFELCVLALDRVGQDLRRLSDPQTRAAFELFR